MTPVGSDILPKQLCQDMKTGAKSMLIDTHSENKAQSYMHGVYSCNLTRCRTKLSEHTSLLAKLGIQVLCELASHQVLTLPEVFCEDILSGLNYECLCYCTSGCHDRRQDKIKPTLTCAGLFGFVLTFCLADADEADQICTPQCRHCRLRKALADRSDLKTSWVGTGCNRLFML